MKTYSDAEIKSALESDYRRGCTRALLKQLGGLICKNKDIYKVYEVKLLAHRIVAGAKDPMRVCLENQFLDK